MAGAGKSTVGKTLAHHLNWAYVDTDHIIEATYATKLQNVADSLSKEEFLDAEASIVQSCFFNRTVIATGGSVVYREKTMEHLANLGICVYLRVDLNLILERIAKNPERAIAPGQTIEELFFERELLYQKYANITLDAKSMPPKDCVLSLMELFPKDFLQYLQN
jgi:shikimate kinase